ncbi:MAG: T9SS C-terminal target domain-containing protein [Balneolaceae bacterium]|nr:MAG: T9SS C-terminal target domain-containing protein [Balneolaceae bacterium]
MGNIYLPLRLTGYLLSAILFFALITTIASAQDMIQSPVPVYNGDEVNRLSVKGLELMLDEPLTVDLEITALDKYYTYLNYPSHGSTDLSPHIAEKAVLYLESTQFEGKSVNEALRDLAAHLEVTDRWNQSLIYVTLSLPPLHRGSLPFRLTMSADDQTNMRTSVTFNNLQADVPGAVAFDLALDFETGSEHLIEPSVLRSAISDFLNQDQDHDQMLPERTDAFNRLLTAHILDSFEAIISIQSVVSLDVPGSVPLQLESRLTEKGNSRTESVTMSRAGNPEPSAVVPEPGYTLQLEYEEGIEESDFPDLFSLDVLIRGAIATFDTSDTHWRDFMNETLGDIDDAAGNAIRYISFYMDGDTLNDQIGIRYLARKGEPGYVDITLYSGYEITFPALETYFGTVMSFKVELADWLNMWGRYEHIPEPEIIADAVVSQAQNPDIDPSWFEGTATLNRYLVALAWNFGDFTDWYFLYMGDISSRLEGKLEDGSSFEHTMKGSSGESTNLEKEPGIPGDITLLLNYPNPFNPVTTITFELGRATEISLDIFDMLGRRVAVLAGGVHHQGVHNITFDAGNLASGLYIARLKSGNETMNTKMMLLK